MCRNNNTYHFVINHSMLYNNNNGTHNCYSCNENTYIDIIENQFHMDIISNKIFNSDILLFL